MKQIFITLLIVLPTFLIQNTHAQKRNTTEEGYVFKEDFRLSTTEVENQYRSGTCWSFSSLSFMESEMIRTGKGNVNLSEMFVVNRCYTDKAEFYVRMHGHLNFGGGGAFHDIPYVMKKYGLVPEEAYKGLNYGTEKHVHGEIDNILKNYVDAIIKNKNKKLSPTWKKAFTSIIESYLGAYPESFTYKGKKYTPKTFADKVVGLNPDDYIELSSFTHHPYYSKFILEVPDNWLYDMVYNIKLDELERTMDFALKKGYTIAWGADVSHKGFKYSKGVAVIPEADIENMSGLEQSKWEKMSSKDKENELYKLDKPGKEKKITKEIRQEAFDNYSTTDDHGMHIIGIAHDQKGTKYYIVKNSWGTNQKYNGYFYASKAFILMQTMDIMLHKDAIPEDIKKKLKL